MPQSLFLFVGADAHIGPIKSVQITRVDVGIDPYEYILSPCTIHQFLLTHPGIHDRISTLIT